MVIPPAIRLSPVLMYNANGLGVTSHERNEKGMKNSHHEHAPYDRGNSERQRCRLQKHETAQERGDRRKDGDPMGGYLLPARLTFDRTPRTECRLAPEAHGRSTAVRTIDQGRYAAGSRSAARPQAPCGTSTLTACSGIVVFCLCACSPP